MFSGRPNLVERIAWETLGVVGKLGLCTNTKNKSKKVPPRGRLGGPQTRDHISTRRPNTEAPRKALCLHCQTRTTSKKSYLIPPTPASQVAGAAQPSGLIHANAYTFLLTVSFSSPEGGHWLKPTPKKCSEPVAPNLRNQCMAITVTMVSRICVPFLFEARQKQQPKPFKRKAPPPQNFKNNKITSMVSCTFL